ncbi:MAG: tetratricopeptide repeat protein [Nevskiales bacterium]|nr:tetratricopeptide repeat protein [Nevskiales bacterium]
MKASTDPMTVTAFRSSLPKAGVRALLLAAMTAVSACSMMGGGPKLPPPPEQPAEPDKGDPQARFEAAMTLWQQHQVQEAEDAFKSLVQDFPDLSGPWTNLGILYAKSNRREMAIGALTKAAALNRENKIAFNWLGILHREAGDLERARLAYERALALDPDYALAHYNLGVLLDAHLQQPMQALPHYRAYLTLRGEDDLRVMAWIAKIEADARAAEPAPEPAPPTAAPTPETTP